MLIRTSFLTTALTAILVAGVLPAVAPAAKACEQDGTSCSVSGGGVGYPGGGGRDGEGDDGSTPGGGGGVDTCGAEKLTGAWAEEQHEKNGTTPEDGYYYYCEFEFQGIPFRLPDVYWSEAPPPPNPGAMAEDIYREVERTVYAIPLGLAPKNLSGKNRTIVGLPVWGWHKKTGKNYFGPVSASTSDRGVSVWLDGKVDKVVWDFGDGTTKTCGKNATRYKASFEGEMSPNCGHRYEKKGNYTVTVRSYWSFDIDSNVGFSTTRSAVLADSTQVQVRELQTARK